MLKDCNWSEDRAYESNSNNEPIEAAAIPLPNEETTPPVIKRYLVFAINIYI